MQVRISIYRACIEAVSELRYGADHGAVLALRHDRHVGVRDRCHACYAARHRAHAIAV